MRIFPLASAVTQFHCGDTEAAAYLLPVQTVREQNPQQACCQDPRPHLQFKGSSREARGACPLPLLVRAGQVSSWASVDGGSGEWVGPWPACYKQLRREPWSVGFERFSLAVLSAECRLNQA